MLDCSYILNGDSDKILNALKITLFWYKMPCTLLVRIHVSEDRPLISSLFTYSHPSLLPSDSAKKTALWRVLALYSGSPCNSPFFILFTAFWLLLFMILFWFINFSPPLLIRFFPLDILCLLTHTPWFFFPSLSFVPLALASIFRASHSLLGSFICTPFHYTSYFHLYIFCLYFFIILYWRS
jgi:hypothetical protein